jgi:hypothetical protein
LFDRRVRHQDLKARLESPVLKRRNRYRVDVAQITGRGRPKLVTSASLEKERQKKKNERFFHYGVAAASGVGCGVAEGAAVESLEGGGAVVVSGRSEAGGGKEASVSDGGNGACSFEEGGGPLSCIRGFSFFLLAAAAVTAGACNFASPTFARSSLMRFLAFSPSVEPGWVRMTSL